MPIPCSSTSCVDAKSSDCTRQRSVVWMCLEEWSCFAGTGTIPGIPYCLWTLHCGQQMKLDVKQLGSKQMPVDAISSSQLMSYQTASWCHLASHCGQQMPVSVVQRTCSLAASLAVTSSLGRWSMSEACCSSWLRT